MGPRKFRKKLSISDEQQEFHDVIGDILMQQSLPSEVINGVREYARKKEIPDSQACDMLLHSVLLAMCSSIAISYNRSQ